MTSRIDPKPLSAVGKDITTTPEERAELEASGHGLLESLARAGKEGGLQATIAAAWLASWRCRNQNEPKAQAAEVREMVAPGGQSSPEQGSLMQWCGFPTDMTRVSPFFPMAQDDMKERPFLREFLITAAGWGEIRYSGPKLSTYDEDVLLVLLAVLEQQSQYRHQTFTYEANTEYNGFTGNYDEKMHAVDEEIDGVTRKTYTYRGPALPLLKILGYKRPNGKDYKRLIGSLELLAVAGVKLKVAARTKTGKRKEPRFTSMSSMLSNVAWNEEKKELSATINPFFYETYFSGHVSLMDVQKRMAIGGSIAKGLYRFVQSHSSKTPLWTGHFLTLAQTLNMNTEQPAFKLRQLLKTAINELVTQGILAKQSRIMKQDIVTLYRVDGALPPPGRSRKKLKS